MDKQSADILRRAKALIDRPEKWCKGTQQDEQGRMCMHGAISTIAWGRVYMSGPQEGRLCVLLRQACGMPVRESGVADFNNASTTTHADVMAAFDRAIALAEGRISDEAYTARFISEAVESVKYQEVATAK